MAVKQIAEETGLQLVTVRMYVQRAKKGGSATGRSIAKKNAAAMNGGKKQAADYNVAETKLIYRYMKRDLKTSQKVS